ncbi:MAG: thiamine phosphate synthase [Acidobacteria bacterium]|nr:thiamine phosphate synthase [Acidobacteriota bacterium]
MFPLPAFRFYPIIDTEVCASRGVDPLAAAVACFRGGARLLQVRVKGGTSAEFLSLTEEIVAAAAGTGATVIVNDRADIARLAAAGGVHVGQEDLPVESARAIVGTGLVGVSTHQPRQVEEALRTSADYVAVGPVYGTLTKATGSSPRGLDLVRYAAAGGKPVVGIGGITLSTAPDVLEAGAASVAVISDLLSTGDIEARAGEYVRILESG